MTINSGFRCEKHNKEVKGKPDSQHMLGKAVDVSTSKLDGLQKHRLLKLANAMKFRGIGVYPTFIHLDVRDNQSFWVGS